MKDLYRFLSPFAPDISGAVSVLFELEGLIVICDAGGCTGNTCGFDEPRWYTKKSAIYSAGLRDLDAILGRDEKLLDKIGHALESVEVKFIALVGTPVPAVIATDYQALSQLCQKRFHLPTLYIDTNGMESYVDGQIKAYQALSTLFPQVKGKKQVGLWGASPLDLPSVDSVKAIQKRLNQPMLCFGMDDALENYCQIQNCHENIVVSPAGLKMVKKLNLPYRCDFGLGQWKVSFKKTLIIHQQIFANAIREAIGFGDVASFFQMDPEFMQERDCFLEGENDLIRLVRQEKYERILGDPLFLRALKDYQGEYISLPHFAVSGQIHQSKNDVTYFEQLEKALCQ